MSADDLAKRAADAVRETLEAAETRAAEIVREAEAEAERIRAEARRQATELREAAPRPEPPEPTRPAPPERVPASQQPVPAPAGNDGAVRLAAMKLALDGGDRDQIAAELEERFGAVDSSLIDEVLVRAGRA